MGSLCVPPMTVWIGKVTQTHKHERINAHMHALEINLSMGVIIRLKSHNKKF